MKLIQVIITYFSLTLKSHNLMIDDEEILNNIQRKEHVRMK
jgi:hypothetical protein